MSDSVHTLAPLFDLVARLRSPDGCPWDREQGLADIRAYLLEEAHEVAAAIDARDWPEIRDELGDLLFQIVFIVQLAREQSIFDLDEVVEAIHQKMIDRHPHVFGDETLTDSRAVHAAWERRKLEDKYSNRSILGGLPKGLPALLEAYRMTQKAAGVGFDWPDHQAVLDKVDEELAELRLELEAASQPKSSPEVRAELGDLLLTLANLARQLGHDPEAVLAEANRKFRRRVTAMEEDLDRQGLTLADIDAPAMEALWKKVKERPESH